MTLPILAAADLAEPLRRMPVESVLLLVLVQLVVILVAARIAGMLFRLAGQPAVVGEIAAGVVLGPSVFGYFFPDAWYAVFHPAIAGVDPALFDAMLNWVLSMLSQIGLVFLLFLVGLEFDFAHLRGQGKSAAAISISGVLLPMAIGVSLAHFMHPYLEPHPASGEAVPKLGFQLFLGTALAITAIPVLGRIVVELGIQRTRLGAIAIAAAAVNDAAGWILLAAVAAIVGGSFQASSVLTMIGLTALFTAAMLLIVRPLMRRWAAHAMSRGNGDLAASDLAVLILAILLCAIATNLIGVFAIFGAFLLGACLSGEHEFREAVAGKMRDFMTVFFMPIFFTYTGLRTNLGSLETPLLWMLCLAVLAAAIVGKLGGCALAAWLSGMKRREAAAVGAMMNTRGLIELIVVNMGYELGVIPPSVYCMLVIMALVTTAMTTPLLVALARGTELEAPIRAAGFLRR